MDTAIKCLSQWGIQDQTAVSLRSPITMAVLYDTTEDSLSAVQYDSTARFHVIAFEFDTFAVTSLLTVSGEQEGIRSGDRLLRLRRQPKTDGMALPLSKDINPSIARITNTFKSCKYVDDARQPSLFRIFWTSQTLLFSAIMFGVQKLLASA